MHARDVFNIALGDTEYQWEAPVDLAVLSQINNRVDSAKYIVLIRADAGYSDDVRAIGVGSSQIGCDAAARLALAAHVFSSKTMWKAPDPTEDNTFPNLVERLRLWCIDFTQ